MYVCLLSNWQRQLPKLDELFTAARGRSSNGSCNVKSPSKQQSKARAASECFAATKDVDADDERAEPELRKHVLREWKLWWVQRKQVLLMFN